MVRRIARRLLLADFVADDAANGRTADGSDRATARKNGTPDGANPGAYGGALVLCRHAGTTA